MFLISQKLFFLYIVLIKCLDTFSYLIYIVFSLRNPKNSLKYLFD